MTCDFCHLPVPTGRHGDEGPLFCCYGCKLAAEITHSRGEAGQVNWMLTRLGISVFLSMIVMMFSMYLYRQHFVDDALASPVSAQLSGVMRYLSLMFATPVFFMLGWPILQSALEDWRRGRFSTDALVVLGVAAALALSYASTLMDRGAVYYETACAVLVFMTLGRWLEANGKLKASVAVAGLEALIPDEVSVDRGGETLRVRSREILEGDLLIIPAGQRIAADALIEMGRAGIDESILTGEASPVVKEPGNLVRAGTLNLDGLLRARAVTVGGNSTLGRLMAILEEAKRTRCRWERLTDRISRAFIPITLALAALGFSLGLFRGGLDRAVLTSLSVLLIACPCALGIATPMAVWVALGSAARRGILFRSGEKLESLAGVRAVCFDKTGTLTSGSPTVRSFVAPDVDDEVKSLSFAVGMANASGHPLALGILSWCRRRNVFIVDPQEARTIPGRGVLARWDGTQVALGNLALMRDQGLALDDALREHVAMIEAASRSFSCIGWGHRVRGIFEFAESLRPEARDALAKLEARGVEVRILTGDHPQRAQSLAREFGAETRGGLTSEEKVAEIRSLRHSAGPVAMVGDGLNDAPALAAADVGIAMGCGADLTRESGDLCLLGNNLVDVSWALDLAGQTVRIIKVNLFWAFAYNLIGIGLALAGLLTPIFAAAAMIVSSLMVVGNSLRLNLNSPPLAPRAPVPSTAQTTDCRGGESVVSHSGEVAA